MPDVARPIASIGGRPQEHGRIRFGVKTANAMKALKTWRFTSPDREAIAALADLYGGTVTEWNEPKANPQNQWQVITTSAAINVMLPPDALSTSYELWSGKGCIRRCDGDTVAVLTSDPNQPMQEVPCKCNAQGYMECKPKSRLKVLLPEIRMAGFWRMETGSWNALEELAAMERALTQMQQHGILVGRLALHQQSDLDKAGKRRHYVVPRLEFNETTAELLAGASQALALPTGGPVPGVTGPATALPALGAGDAWFAETGTQGPPPVAGGNLDDEVIEAEIVEEEGEQPATPSGDREPSPPPPKRSPKQAPVRARMHATIGDIAKTQEFNPDELRHGIVRTITQGRSESSRDLTDQEVGRIVDYLDEVLAGERLIQMRSGEVRFPKKERT